MTNKRSVAFFGLGNIEGLRITRAFAGVVRCETSEQLKHTPSLGERGQRDRVPRAHSLRTE